MENKMNNYPKMNKALGGTKADSQITDSPREIKMEKKDCAEQIQKPTRLYFSSPCLLSELEDNEEILNI